MLKRCFRHYTYQAVILVLLLMVWFPVSGFAASVTSSVAPGLNVIGVTASLVADKQTAFTLLSVWKAAGVTAIESYNSVNGILLRAELNSDGISVGADFPLVENSALYVYASQQNTLSLGSRPTCAPLNLVSGFNLAGHACFPPNYQVSEFINSVGFTAITSISRLDLPSGRWQTVAVDNGTMVGDDFPLVPGEGYIVHAAAVTGWTSPQPVISAVSPSPLSTFATPGTIAISGNHFKADSVVTINGVAVSTSYVNGTLLNATVPLQSAPATLTVQVKNPDTLHAGGYFISESASLTIILPPLTLTPNALTIQQGQPGGALIVTLPGAAPVGGTTIDLISSDSTLVSVAAQITVPEGATSASVPLSVPDTGSTTNKSVTVTASRVGLTSAQATLSVRPKPTINLSPLSTLTGLTFTYLLTVNLSDVAPSGGFPVSLTAVPAGIVSLPSSVTVPSGSSSTQVTVTATAVGTAVISATSPGRGFSGAQNAVTVTPIQTMNYGPVITVPVGVTVAVPSSGNGVNVAYGAFVSGSVGVVVGSTITGIVPSTGATGTTNMKVTVTGIGLSSATGVAFQPATGITVQPGSFAINSSGNPEVVITIDTSAPTTARTIVVALPGGTAMPGAPGANQFRVTLPEPQILGMQPIRAMTGQIISLNVFGKNFTSASSIDFTPSTVISVNNPPIINATGDLATVTVSIDAGAPVGNRVVTISTPGWNSSLTPSVANTFLITADSGTTYTPLVSRELGVVVAGSSSTNGLAVAYGPAASRQIGIVVGSTMSGVVPPTGAIGSNNMKVTVTGVGLTAATAIAFQPATGITVHPGSFVINGDGNPEVTIDIDPTAPTISRAVIVTLPSGGAFPAVPGANQFRVTLPEPQILGMQPIRAMTGQAISLNLFGKNFTSASSIDFTPAAGISVNNPPTISAAGDMATVTVSIATDAPLGSRVVTISTPGWTSSAVPSVATTFSVTADAGTTYTPLVSREVGVTVQSPSSANNPAMTYGPVTSLGVGVLVTPVAAPTTQNITYMPIVSTQVGVSVGGALTGISPLSVEPGSTTTLKLTGSGLNLATAIRIVPATGITIGAWTPASDGRSGTVVITADTTTPIGKKTVAALTTDGSIKAAGPGAGLLLVGYRPTVNSISPILPTVGTTFTLTINGVHLQDATRVDILPADNVAIDNKPVWSSDGTGEHLTVTVVIDSSATPGDRVVVITTPYGVTTMVGSPANTISFFKPGVALLSQPEEQLSAVASAAAALFEEPAEVWQTDSGQPSGLTPQRIKSAQYSTTDVSKFLPEQLHISAHNASPKESCDCNGYLYAGYRGPPGFPMAQEFIHLRRIT